jgi:hypothetical protein
MMQHFEAPNIATARAVAEQEVAFAESLCTVPQDSVIAVQRSYDNGAVRETFRTLRRRDGAAPTGAFSFFEVEGEDEPSEEVDLVTLAEREQK